ncbi:YqjF family protein [Domibacillus tundrae]|uniref:YqjF family protein n=1 Tax=Domibacillus tundrae TaxID=1587527 RepID=UPI00339A51CE
MSLEFKETNQRPFPLPASPWIMKQRWDNMLFLHWPVPANLLASHIPADFSLDLFQGRAWISIVPFWARHTRLRGLPRFPFYHSYLELNVRTYMTYNGVPGIYFFSLGANKWPVVLGAKTASFLPYYHANMNMSVQNKTVHFQSKRIQFGNMAERFQASYSPSSPIFTLKEGSLDWWLLERYCFWVQKGSHVFRGDIHHNRWRVTEAACVIHDQTLPSFLPHHVFSEKPLAHFSYQKNVFTWPLKKER